MISFPVRFYNWWSSNLITCYGHILVRKDSSITALSHMTRLADFARVSVPPQQHLCILFEIWRLSITKWWSVPSLSCLIHFSCRYFNVLCLIWRLTTTWGLVFIMFRGLVVFNVYLIWINTRIGFGSELQSLSGLLFLSHDGFTYKWGGMTILLNQVNFS